MKYTVTLTDRRYYEVEIEAENDDMAHKKADEIDWDFLIAEGADGDLYADGLEVESVEEA